MSYSVGMFGGTFDPVHNGHILIARELKQLLGLNEMRLVPCALPSHRPQPRATQQQRLKLLELATAGTGLSVDTRELERSGASYTIDTLQSLRAELGATCSLQLCVGTDVFCQLDHWHRWEEILGFAHIVVAQRAGHLMDVRAPLEALLAEREVNEVEALGRSPCGGIYLASVSQIPVSSTQVRQCLLEGRIGRDTLPEAVQRYIEENGLYRAE